MTGVLLATMIPLAYLTGWVLFARWYFQLKRPYTEPVGCAHPEMHSNNDWHHGGCFRRPGTLIDSAGEAAVIASLLGFVWPLLLLAYGFRRAVTAVLGPAGKPLPEETAAKTKRLEHELGMEDRR